MRFVGVAFLLVLLAAPMANAARFGFGVAAGEVTATSALLWARAGATGPVALEVLRGGRVVQRRRAVARRADDLTVGVAARGLRPGTRYAYRFRQSRSVSAQGSFRTARARGTSAQVRFAISGDADATPGPMGPA